MTDQQGTECDAMWGRFMESSEGSRSYEAKTTWVIPVLRSDLTRATAAGPDRAGPEPADAACWAPGVGARD